MVKQVTAVHDPSLAATVVRRTPLLYAEGPDPAQDRPAHVRAGSSLAWLGGRLAVVQDDAGFIALTDPLGRRVEAVALPAGEGGARQFDDLRGNKRFKLDLEACTVVPDGAGGEVLAAFGSGSTPLRERVVLLSEGAAGPRVSVHDASALYALLRECTEFSGSELNVEGALWTDGRIRLFNRGNGAPRGGLLPVDATCELEWAALRAHLLDPASPPPRPADVVRYHLGEMDGLRLTFTDAAWLGERVVFSAAAEDSPDATRDGWVAGSALGVFDAPDRLRWTVLRNPDGGVFVGKVEGVAPAPGEPGRAYVVLDRDDPALPCEMCEVELSGPWG